ncbi:hypothetical protein M0R45_007607 [Rubus argutus]|uniref:F-box domain-containing protein n=1 Tax=Rubus argutus TaxID=59490 RepID=A0AAW1XZM2_RUBAR
MMMMMMETKQKKNPTCYNCNIGNECSCWQTPPQDILEKILQLVYLGDQIRLGLVCKFWRSIVLQRDMRGSPHEIPWLILPQAPNFKNKLSFLTFPEGKLSKGKVFKLNLPKPVKGGWIYGSSKGWLIIIKEKGLKSKMYLLNPISGTLHQLPPLKTIPYFKEFVKTREWELLGANGFCYNVALSTSDGINSSSHFTVAAVFEDKKTLGLCRPGDETWSVFPVLDINQDDCLLDILFSSSTLYALVRSEQTGRVVPTSTLNFAYHDGNLKLKLVYDKHERTNKISEYQGDSKIIPNATYRSKLLESTSKEVLLIHQMVDYVWKTENDCDAGLNIEDDEENIVGDEGDDENDGGGNSEDDERDNGDGEVEGNNEGNDSDDGDELDNENTNVCVRTRSFRTYKIDPYNNYDFDMTQCLGDQILFFGDDGSFAIPASDIKEVENNCIYFAINLFWYQNLERLLLKPYTSDELGICYLKGQKIERPFQGMEMSVFYQASWFTPSL